MVILDGDVAGEEAKNQYINEFGDFVKNRISTLNDIANINGYIEKMIKEEDKKTICEEIFGQSNSSIKKKALSQAINQLLFEKKAVNISKETKDNFKIVLKFVRNYFNQ